MKTCSNWPRLVQTCSKLTHISWCFLYLDCSDLVKHICPLARHDQTSWDSNWLVQSFSDLLRLTQTCSNLFKLVQTCSYLLKLAQTCSDLLKLAQTCFGLHDTCKDFHSTFQRKKRCGTIWNDYHWLFGKTRDNNKTKAIARPLCFCWRSLKNMCH